MIRLVSPHDDFKPLTQLLNAAFGTVAEEFALTKENSPTNAAFVTNEELRSQLTDRREFYRYEENGKTSGFVAIERSEKEPATFFIEKLAVSLDARHHGVGTKLMDFAQDRIWQLGGKTISLGLIDANTRLKNWYAAQGFVIVEIKTFAHLPFDVCFMTKSLDEERAG